jgi:hypothetical protein
MSFDFNPPHALNKCDTLPIVGQQHRSVEGLAAAQYSMSQDRVMLLEKIGIEGGDRLPNSRFFYVSKAQHYAWY